jgi:hypothetical protein
MQTAIREEIASLGAIRSLSRMPFRTETAVPADRDDGNSRVRRRCQTHPIITSEIVSARNSKELMLNKV